jgi:hypothetical protein
VPSFRWQLTVWLWEPEFAVPVQVPVRIWFTDPVPQVGDQALYTQAPVPPVQAPNPEPTHWYEQLL